MPRVTQDHAVRAGREERDHGDATARSARSGRMIASSSARTTTARHRERSTSPRNDDDLSDRIDAFDAEERRASVRTAAAIAKSTVARIPSRRSTSATLCQHPGRSPPAPGRRAAASPALASRNGRRRDDSRDRATCTCTRCTPTAPSPPRTVMAAAHRRGLGTVALTDHDTTSGWAEAAEAAASLG